MYTDRKFSKSVQEEAHAMLRGAYDWHIHNGPAIFPRRADDTAIVAEAVNAGMAGVGFKVHEGDTAARAKMLDSPECRVFGGVCLNHFVGGLNPAAAEASLVIGGKFVWLPTMASRQHVEFYAKKGAFLGGNHKHGPGAGITVLDDAGKIVPVMADIFELIYTYDGILSTGHLSPPEALAVASEFKKGKGNKGTVVMGHPDLNNCQATVEAQAEFARMGGYVEKMVLSLHPDWGNIPVEAFVAGMRQIGLEHCTITTDAGGTDRGSSPETLARFIALVLEERLMTEKELRIVLCDASKRMLNINN